MLPNAVPAAPPTEPVEPQSETPKDFETWLEGQDETVKGLYNVHSESLLNTVRATRKERDDFARQIKELAKGQAEGSEARKALDEMGVKLEVSEKRATFLEESIKPEIQCRNAKAAWLLAQSENLFDRKGNPDWNAIKAEAPELFGLPTASAKAGTGTATPPPATKNMNDFIRTASGRG